MDADATWCCDASIVIPLLSEDKHRKYSLLPIQYPDVWSFYKEHRDAFWVPQEIDMSQDKLELLATNRDGGLIVSDSERHLIKRILSFFAAADFIVAENMSNFMHTVKMPEAVIFYGFQIAMENIHSETYAQLIEVFSDNVEEQTKLSNAVFDEAAVTSKAKWIEKWMDVQQPFALRLIAFAIVEGVFFSGSFCAIFWFKSKGMFLNGLCKSNEFIARDEGIHAQFAVNLYNNHIPEGAKPPAVVIHQMFQDACDIEASFMQDALQSKLLGISAELMTIYIQYVSDFWLKQLKILPIFNVENPFEFMELISMEGKTNFFEQRVSEYRKADMQLPTVMDFGGEDSVF